MPFNGSGSYSLPYNWQTDAANGLDISSSRMQGQDQDIASALSICMTKDGQQTAANNLPMGGFTLTNIANASLQKQPISVQDFQNGTPNWVGTVTGTDTITGAANIAPQAYAAGQKWRGIIAGPNVTSTVTMNFNGLGAVSVPGLAIGAFVAGQIFEVTYDGANFQLSTSNGHGSLVNVQLITASGTYTPTPGATKGFAWVQGAGGAGGGTGATTANGCCAGGGASAGTFAIVDLATLASEAVTIGAAGTGVSGANGNNGGATAFGALCSCPGGLGGGADGAIHGGTSGAGDVGGLAGVPPAAPSGTGNIIFSQQGAPGMAGLALLNPLGGKGGDSFWGSGGLGAPATLGTAGTNYGGAGAGSARTGSQAASTGYNGAQGAVLVFEYT
ncbi:hypothetical protein ABH944_004868 [Caballeronia udeis]|uniref:Tail fiber protein n=1 Tax=Caballeronia udeis TaxID=1232866 RepID=A0ABW8MLS3_9BURK